MSKPCLLFIGVNKAERPDRYSVRDPGFYAQPKRFPRPGSNTARKNDIRRHKSIRPTIKDN